MSRVIKFRAWDIETEAFVSNNSNVEYIWEFDGDGNIQIVTLQTIDLCPGGIGHVQEERWLPIKCIVEQFTGLTDKNGKEIYEGDTDVTGITIKWDEIAASFICMREGNFVDYLGEISNLLIIIGNIHENPDLIK